MKLGQFFYQLQKHRRFYRQEYNIYFTKAFNINFTKDQVKSCKLEVIKYYQNMNQLKASENVKNHMVNPNPDGRK